MKIIICLDVNNGLSFNGRRQSRDRAVIAMIASIVDGQCVRMHPTSEALFSGTCVNIRSSEDYLCTAQENDWCFVETEDVLQFLDVIQHVIVFRWNRKYPNDVCLPQDWLKAGFTKMNIADFEGYSHPKITMEVYSR